MKLFQKKLFFYSAYLTLLLPHTMIGMKRQGSPLEQKLVKKQKTENVCPTLPHDVWNLIAWHDLSNLNSLKQLCSHSNDALKHITIPFLGSTIAQQPETAKSIAQHFYICTKLLYQFAEDNNEQLFNTLWESQSLNDKGIRLRFCETLNTLLSQKDMFTISQCFNSSPVPTSDSFYKDHKQCYIRAYLITALKKKNPQLVHLALSSPVCKDIINCLYIGRNSKTVCFLSEACRISTIECVQLLLNHGADPGIFMPEKTSILYTILEQRYKDIDNLPEKIDLILHYYTKKHPQENNIINLEKNGKTPLIKAFFLFRYKQICLNELIDIIKILLKYGANVYAKTTSGHTIFDKIIAAQESYVGNITSEEAAFITTWLQENTKNTANEYSL